MSRNAPRKRCVTSRKTAAKETRQTTTWNFHICSCHGRFLNSLILGSDDDASPQQLIFHSSPLHENHSCQASERALCLFWTTWPTWDHRTTLHQTQSSILIRRFHCSGRRGKLPTTSIQKSAPVYYSLISCLLPQKAFMVCVQQVSKA